MQPMRHRRTYIIHQINAFFFSQYIFLNHDIMVSAIRSDMFLGLIHSTPSHKCV